MIGTKSFGLLVAIVACCCSVLTHEKDVDPENGNNVGFGLELILAKLEAMELKMLSLEDHNRNLTKLLMEVLEKGSGKSCPGVGTGNAVVPNKENSVIVQNQTEPKVIDKIVTNPDPEPQIDESSIYSSCYEVPPGPSGKFLIRPTKTTKPFYVWCELLNQYGGGWTVIQHRFNGSENFYRNWTEYKHGFGSLDFEFWLGLDKIHLLTSLQKHEIVFEMVDFAKTYKFARYAGFEIGTEEEGYFIKQLGAYTGTAGDAFTYHSGMKFSTFDSDNDKFYENCAKDYYGAWWYRSCFKSNLNGKYLNGRNNQAMCWNTFKNGNDGLMRSKIMIRQVV